MRQAENPLAHRHDRKHVVDQVRRAFGHAPTATTGAHCATLARERHQAIASTSRAAEPREPARQDAAAQEPLEFVLDEARQAAVVAAHGFGPETLEVLAHDLIDDARRRRLQSVRARRDTTHAVPIASAGPPTRNPESRRNAGNLVTMPRAAQGFSVPDVWWSSQILRRRPAATDARSTTRRADSSAGGPFDLTGCLFSRHPAWPRPRSGLL